MSGTFLDQAVCKVTLADYYLDKHTLTVHLKKSSGGTLQNMLHIIRLHISFFLFKYLIVDFKSDFILCFNVV